MLLLPASAPLHSRAGSPPCSLCPARNRNPSNLGTWVRFSLPSRQRARLPVFNIRGELVRTLAGRDSSGRTGSRLGWSRPGGEQVGSSLYLVQLPAGERVATQKVVLWRCQGRRQQQRLLPGLRSGEARIPAPGMPQRPNCFWTQVAKQGLGHKSARRAPSRR